MKTDSIHVFFPKNYILPHSFTTSFMVLHTRFQNKISSLYNTQFTIPGEKYWVRELNDGEKFC
jgi:hypothetical protein